MDFIKANRADVERAIRDKGIALDLDALLGLDTQIRAMKTEMEALRAERNALSAKFKDASPEERAELGKLAKEAGAHAGKIEGQLLRQFVLTTVHLGTTIRIIGAFGFGFHGVRRVRRQWPHHVCQ